MALQAYNLVLCYLWSYNFYGMMDTKQLAVMSYKEVV